MLDCGILCVLPCSSIPRGLRWICLVLSSLFNGRAKLIKINCLGPLAFPHRYSSALSLACLIDPCVSASRAVLPNSGRRSAAKVQPVTETQVCREIRLKSSAMAFLHNELTCQLYYHAPTSYSYGENRQLSRVHVVCHVTGPMLDKHDVTLILDVSRISAPASIRVSHKRFLQRTRTCSTASCSCKDWPLWSRRLCLTSKVSLSILSALSLTLRPACLHGVGHAYPNN